MFFKLFTTGLLPVFNLKLISFTVSLCCGIVSFTLLAKDLDNLRFPESVWDGQVLYKLEKGPGYLDKNLEFDVPSPPANSSEETKDELRLIEKYALEDRTEEQVKKIHIEAMEGEFSEIYLDEGPINEALRKSTYSLLGFTDKEIVYFIVHYKKRFSRPRPSQLLPNLELVIPNPGHAAYPSGHATQSMVFSMILSMIDPENEEIYIKYAKDIAKRREIAGVHYPTDSSVGQFLAGKLVNALMQESKFIKMLETAKTRFNENKKNALSK